MTGMLEIETRMPEIRTRAPRNNEGCMLDCDNVPDLCNWYPVIVIENVHCNCDLVCFL